MLVIFDWDGTLVKTEHLLSQHVAKLATAAGYPIDTQTVFQKFSGMGSEAKFRAIAAHCELPIDDTLVAELQAGHRAIKENLYAQTTLAHVFENAAATLGDLRAKNHRPAICSNGNLVPLNEAIARVSLSDYFAGRVHTPAALQFKAKPDPATLLHMMRIYKSPAAETVMVGDSNADLQGSGNAGIPHRLAFISPDYTGQAFTDQVIAMRKSGSTAHFSDYRQLPGIIESLTI